MSALILLFAFTHSTAAQNFTGCWSFTDFNGEQTGISELKLNVHPLKQSKNPQHRADLTISTADETYPTGQLTCRPSLEKRATLICVAEDDRGFLEFSLSEGRAKIETTDLNTVIEEVGVIIRAADDDPYIAHGQRGCKSR